MRCRVVSYGFGFRSVEGEGEAEEEENGQWEGQKKGERGTGGGVGQPALKEALSVCTAIRPGPGVVSRSQRFLKGWSVSVFEWVEDV